MGVLFSKAVGTPLLIRIAGSYSGQDLTQVTFTTSDPTPIGSQTLAGIWQGATPRRR